MSLTSKINVVIVVVVVIVKYCCCSCCHCHQSDLPFIIQVGHKLICKPLLLVVTKVTAHELQRYVLLGKYLLHI